LRGALGEFKAAGGEPLTAKVDIKAGTFNGADLRRSITGKGELGSDRVLDPPAKKSS